MKTSLFVSLILTFCCYGLYAEEAPKEDLQVKKKIVVPKLRAQSINKTELKQSGIDDVSTLNKQGPAGKLSMQGSNKDPRGKEMISNSLYSKFCNKVLITAIDPNGKVYRLKRAKYSTFMKSVTCQTPKIDVPSNVELKLTAVLLDKKEGYRVVLDEDRVKLKPNYPGNSANIVFRFARDDAKHSGLNGASISIKGNLKDVRRGKVTKLNAKTLTNKVDILIWPGGDTAENFKDVCSAIEVTTTLQDGSVQNIDMVWFGGNLIDKGQRCSSMKIYMPAKSPIIFKAKLTSAHYRLHQQQQTKTFDVNDRDPTVVFNVSRK